MVGPGTGGQLIAALLWLATPDAPPAPAPDPQLLLYLAEFGDDDESALDPLEFDDESIQVLPALDVEKKHENDPKKE